MGKVFFLLIALGIGQEAVGLTLGEVREKLSRSGATWVAGETSVSGLRTDEKRRMTGAILEEGADAVFMSRMPRERLALPGVHDWRNVGGINYASPMLNQGRCGSCVAFAAVGTMETQMNIARNTPDSPWAYSTQHLFSCGGGGCASGWQPASAATYLRDTGVPDEACFPYASGANGEDMACSSTCGGASSRSHKIVRYTTPTFFFASNDEIKKALMKGPLMTTMLVYEDFYFYKAGVYHHVTGEMLGGHAVSIIGWNDAEQAWIVRNSWGEDWGDRGYVKIGWADTSGLGRQTWGLEAAPATGFVTLGGLRDKEVLKGKVTLNAVSTIPGTQAIHVGLTREDRELFWLDANGARQVSLDTTVFKDGVYEIAATAHHNGGTTKGQPRQVYVLNGPFDGSVWFTNIAAGQSITGAFTLNFEMKASPVPFTKVTFRARHVTTGEESTRSTTNVAPKMAMSWRTQNLPKGEYDLTLEGGVGTVAKVVSNAVRVKVE